MAPGAPAAASPSRQLLARIITHRRTVTIERTDGHNRCEPVGATAQQAMQAAANGVGTDAIVHINQPTMVPGAANTEATVAGAMGAPALAATPASILLGHELIHADRCIRGISSFSQQPVYGGGMTWTGTLGSFVRNNNAAALAEEEIYTIGLPVAGTTAPNPDQQAVTENALRAEHQQPNRIGYP
ncbi:MAG TPA: M91 family zinc metallopeptidase [Bryobacteraceae bacterium]|nr:M91 family zinc metallopeptidase [Bryobacteraceae bacterium]